MGIGEICSHKLAPQQETAPALGAILRVPTERDQNTVFASNSEWIHPTSSPTRRKLQLF
jgi:hypothetical protein